MGTANSMCMLTEVLGMALPGAGAAPAVSNKRKRIAKASGRAVMELLEKNITPRTILTREALLNGIAGAMANGSSTNLVLHLLAIAHEANVSLTIPAGTVIVIRYEGPKGGPGMREMLSTTSLIMGRGMDEECALITDGRFSGATHGPCIGHISPEAAAKGPIAFVEDEDEIEIDIPNRTLKLMVSESELKKRKGDWKPVIKPRKPALAKYAAFVSSADTGAIMELPYKTQ